MLDASSPCWGEAVLTALALLTSMDTPQPSSNSGARVSGDTVGGTATTSTSNRDDFSASLFRTQRAAWLGYVGCTDSIGGGVGMGTAAAGASSVAGDRARAGLR